MFTRNTEQATATHRERNLLPGGRDEDVFSEKVRRAEATVAVNEKEAAEWQGFTRAQQN